MLLHSVAIRATLCNKLLHTVSLLHTVLHQCLLQFIEVIASYIPNCLSKVSPQIFNGIETTYVLVRFPLFDNVSSVAWGTIILEDVLREWQSSWEYPDSHPCWGCLSVEWETQFLGTTLHPSQSRHRHQITLWVQHNCFCMLHALFSSQTPDHRFERVILDSSLQSTID